LFTTDKKKGFIAKNLTGVLADLEEETKQKSV